MDDSNRQSARDRRLQEQQDHEVALRLAGYDVPSSIASDYSKADEDLAREIYEDELSQLLESTSLTTEAGPSTGKTNETLEISAQEDQPGDTDARAFVQGRAPRNCVACHDSPGIIAVPCDHRYCVHCLTEVFRNAMSDGSAFPPRCCRQEIPIADIRLYLDQSFVQEFEKRAVELGAAHQLYCYESTCSAFIPTDKIRADDNAQCPDCSRWTCMHCKAQRHDGDCQEDEKVQQLLQVASQEGWRRCECGIMIELNTGCHHMTVSPTLAICWIVY
ncbi:uncharacterized protein RCC_10379 [Ramularia collo-cygni]|uniref:IBR domain-containing protein n=1 Tax=Ramularia collo-cygni TaxID=112498 RepID=A0A2D3V9F4_9PEZI|nr:uncharacterized protein RCC_10379 [Ramularia collo-cygni]CZT24653.1 uncharacterized protein RCC_10379 [Ramularia collo-cygni]